MTWRRAMAVGRVLLASGVASVCLAQTPPPAPPATIPDEDGTEIQFVTPTPPAPPVPAVTLPPAQKGFTGRYRWGPEVAPVRVVVFSGYQCADCKVAEEQILAVLAVRQDISLSIKQFPLSSRCNKYMQGQNPHPFACVAARVAEAAGLLGGDKAFRSMSDWLFSVGGEFSEAQFDEAVKAMGMKPEEFKGILQNRELSETLNTFIAADIDEGVSLGLTQTPMIFVNGNELRDWRGSPGALRDAIIRIAATSPPTQSAEFDKPPTAADKHLSDWRRQPQMNWPDAVRVWPGFTPGQPATIEVQVWSDLLEPNTAKLDARIREILAKRPADAPSVRYSFRSFPADQSCNPELPRTAFANGCLAAKAIDAAGRLGGEAAANKTRAWILANQQTFSAETLAAAGDAIGVPGAAVVATAKNPELDRGLADEIRQGKVLGMPSIPRLFINGRPLVGWDLPPDASGKDVIERALELAPTLSTLDEKK